MKTIATMLTVLPWAIASAAGPPSDPAAIPAAAFAQLPMMSDAELSPDGEWIAYFAPVGGRTHVVVQPLQNVAERLVLPPVDKLDFDWIRWANDERLVFAVSFSGERWGTETRETRLGSTDRKGDVKWIVKAAEDEWGQRMRGTDGELPPPQIQDNVIDWLANDPGHILVSVDEDFDGRNEVRRIEVATGNHRVIRREMRGIDDWITDQTGEIRFGFGQYEGFKARLKDEDGNWRAVARTGWWERGLRPVAFTADPGIAYMTVLNDTGFRMLQTMRLADGEIVETIFESDRYDFHSLVVDRVTGKPVGYSYIDDYRHVVYFDAELDRLQRSLDKVHPTTRNRIVGMSADRMQLLVHSASDTDPGVYYHWNRHSKAMEFVAETMPGLPPELLSATRPVHYPARDGTLIPAYLNLPAGRKPGKLPAVVLPHGGPHARSDSDFFFLSQFLASRGYAVLQPNFRGSTGYGRAFEEAGRNQWGGIMQDDVADGARWLIDEGIADPERLCIAGWSYGGYAAAMGAVKTPGLYRCAISINGVFNLPRMISDDKEYLGGRIWTKTIGLEGEKLKTVSPYHRADEIAAPMLIIQARDDARIPERQATGMARRLRKLDKSVETVFVDLGGHGMNNAEARLKILTATEAFLARHIGG